MDALAVVNQVMGALRQLSDWSVQVPDEELPKAVEFTRNLASVVESVQDRIKQRGLAYVRQHGSQQTEKGTLAAVVGDVVLRAVPVRTGIDPKKLEARLRALRQDPSVAMDAVVTWKVNTAKLDEAINKGVLNSRDLLACQYDPSFRLEVKHAE